jgi:uncharacterized protein YbjT (DUF2867 family)
MTRLARLARRYPILPTPGLGLARQQPIFHKDLAAVAAWAAIAPEALGQVLPIGGPDVLRLRAMYGAVSRAAGGTGVVVPVPMAALRLVKRAIGDGFPLDEAQLARVRAEKHVEAADSLPQAVRPKTTFREGLAQLLSAMG